jgi:ubiquinone/menaquinone biosynthesis C-methylase UbiE
VISLKLFVKRLLFRSPSAKISSRFTPINEYQYKELESVLYDSYYSQYNSFIEGSCDIKRDIYDQTRGRLQKFRLEVIPWLNNNKELNGACILEVGCGTGSSTVAFAEQGAHVTALDVDEQSLFVAKERLKIYGQQAELVLGNGQEIDKLFSGRHFDFIIFSATLEHMTYEERIGSLKAAFSLMGKGDFLTIIETPNRLWYYDFHTAFLPFYFWLPDDLAFEYSSRSKRKNFSEIYTSSSPEQILHFRRRGRGVSYHDFEIAFGEFDSIEVISSMEIFRKRKAFRYVTDRFKGRQYLKYKRLLMSIAPGYHEGFFEPWLDLVFMKS